MKCRSEYEVLRRDEASAIRTFRSKALARNISIFFTVHILVYGDKGEVDQRISLVRAVDQGFLRKLGFSTSVFKHIFDGVSWRSKPIYSSYDRSVSNRLVLFTEQDFRKYLESVPKELRPQVRDGRKQARRLLNA